MPVEIKDLDDGVGVIITGWGILTEEEWIDSLAKHLTQDKDKFKKYRYSLSDYTAVTETKISNNAINVIATYCEDASEVNPKPVVVIVADQDILFGLSRMWELLVDSTDWETMVFRNRDDAEAWISEKVKEKYGIDDLKFT